MKRPCMEHGREHISPHAKKGLCWANRRLCRPSQGWWGEGAGARRTRGEENYKRFCGVPFQGRRPKGNVIVVVWYTSSTHTAWVYNICACVEPPLPCSRATRHEPRRTPVSACISPCLHLHSRPSTYRPMLVRVSMTTCTSEFRTWVYR